MEMSEENEKFLEQVLHLARCGAHETYTTQEQFESDMHAILVYRIAFENLTFDVPICYLL